MTYVQGKDTYTDLWMILALVGALAFGTMAIENRWLWYWLPCAGCAAYFLLALIRSWIAVRKDDP